VALHVNLLSLGVSGREIFALHDPAVKASTRARAAVICNPLGAEQVYAHRALRHLAVRLSRRGIHVLRFDYYGTGDSGGEDADVTREGMLDDVAFAVDAARDAAATAQVALIGLRAGADVAAAYARRHAGDVAALVLWDPLEVPVVPDRLAPRTLLLHTHGAMPMPGAVQVEAPCCWDESITTSGALPIGVFQQVDAWLR
jgi:pimeloyl-ACP methyl ester carboxylesterase